MKTNIKRKGNT